MVKKELEKNEETTTEVAIVENTPEKECSCENCKCRGGNKTAIVLSSVALLAALTSTVFSVLSYQKSVQPLTILNSGADGNSASFVEGSVADIVDKVSKSVVSIVTSIKGASYFGQS